MKQVKTKNFVSIILLVVTLFCIVLKVYSLGNLSETSEYTFIDNPNWRLLLTIGVNIPVYILLIMFPIKLIMIFKHSTILNAVVMVLAAGFVVVWIMELGASMFALVSFNVDILAIAGASDYLLKLALSGVTIIAYTVMVTREFIKGK